METNTTTYIGVDLAKLTFDAFIGGQGLTLPNNKAGIGQLITHVKRASKPCHVCCEATGSYGDLLIRTLLAKGIPVSQVNPVFIRDYIRSFGRLAKTDRIDARFIARYASDRHPAPLCPGALGLMAMREKHRHIRHLIRLRADLKASLDKYLDPGIRKSVAGHIRHHDREIKKLEDGLLSLVKSDPALHRKYRALTGINSVGPKTALTLVLDMPELGSLNRSQVASLAGLAPVHNDSGAFRGKRHIRRGRKAPRSALYMAALTASFKNPVLSPFYRKLRQQGKHHQVALIAVARKLLIHINTTLKNLTPPSPEKT